MVLEHPRDMKLGKFCFTFFYFCCFGLALVSSFSLSSRSSESVLWKSTFFFVRLVE